MKNSNAFNFSFSLNSINLKFILLLKALSLGLILSYKNKIKLNKIK
jgi:hypothetical protein